jgi:hypothetical protein
MAVECPLRVLPRTTWLSRATSRLRRTTARVRCVSRALCKKPRQLPATWRTRTGTKCTTTMMRMIRMRRPMQKSE